MVVLFSVFGRFDTKSFIRDELAPGITRSLCVFAFRVFSSLQTTGVVFWGWGDQRFWLCQARTLSADRPIFDGLTWEALCRVSKTVAFARRLTNLQMIGFRAPFCRREGTWWAMSISDRNTSVPISWNNFMHRALVSAAVSLLFSGKPIIFTLNW